MLHKVTYMNILIRINIIHIYILYVCVYVYIYIYKVNYKKIVKYLQIRAILQ